MKKLNKKGFFLVETLVVISIVAIVLTLFYRQITNLYFSYEQGFNYDTVQAVHAANNIRIFLEEEGIEEIFTAMGDDTYIDITNYNFSNSDFYSTLKEKSDIKDIYFTYYDISDLVEMAYDEYFDAALIRYLKTIEVFDLTNPGYRLIITLNDGSYTNIELQP